jgi:hypothetical protein
LERCHFHVPFTEVEALIYIYYLRCISIIYAVEYRDQLLFIVIQIVCKRCADKCRTDGRLERQLGASFAALHSGRIPYAFYIRQQAMIRKLASGEYRLYSRKKNPKTGRRRNLGTFATRSAAEKHERDVQYFKRHG